MFNESNGVRLNMGSGSLCSLSGSFFFFSSIEKHKLWFYLTTVYVWRHLSKTGLRMKTDVSLWANDFSLVSLPRNRPKHKKEATVNGIVE